MIKIMKKYFSVPILLILLLGCGELWKLVPYDPKNDPVISKAYAPEKIKPGTPWKIFIEAEDKDGDMKNIVASITPAGQSILFYSTTSVKEEERGALSGYLLVKTPPSPYLQGKMFHVTVFVRDKSGRKSKSAGFLLQFVSEGSGEVEEKWQEASDNRLGIILSDYLTEYVRDLTSSRE